MLATSAQLSSQLLHLQQTAAIFRSSQCRQPYTGRSHLHAQVANAFKAARRQWHPDRHRHETLEQQAYAEEMFKLLSFHAPK